MLIRRTGKRKKAGKKEKEESKVNSSLDDSQRDRMME